MNETVLVALIVGSSSIFGPVILAYLTNRQREQDKREDFARQDEVAAQAAVAASLLEARQNAQAAQAVIAARLLSDRQDAQAAKAAEAARLLLAANERVARQSAEADAATQGQLRVIHTLVNSNMTAAMQAEADAIERELVLMEEVLGLHAAAGVTPSIAALATIEATKDKIAELNAALADRKRQTQAANALNLANAKQAGPTK